MRIVHTKASLRGRDQRRFVTEAQKKVADAEQLPPGYHRSWGGQFENQQHGIKHLMIGVPLSLASIFVLRFWAFRSATVIALLFVFDAEDA